MCRLYQLFVKAVPVVGLPFGKSLALNFHIIALFLPHAQNINIKCWCWCFLIDWHLNCDEFAHHKIPPYHNVRHFCHNGRQFLGRNTFYPQTIFHQEKLSTKKFWHFVGTEQQTPPTLCRVSDSKMKISGGDIDVFMKEQKLHLEWLNVPY